MGDTEGNKNPTVVLTPQAKSKLKFYFQSYVKAYLSGCKVSDHNYCQPICSNKLYYTVFYSAAK